MSIPSVLKAISSSDTAFLRSLVAQGKTFSIGKELAMKYRHQSRQELPDSIFHLALELVGDADVFWQTINHPILDKRVLQWAIEREVDCSKTTLSTDDLFATENWTVVRLYLDAGHIPDKKLITTTLLEDIDSDRCRIALLKHVDAFSFLLSYVNDTLNSETRMADVNLVPLVLKSHDFTLNEIKMLFNEMLCRYGDDIFPPLLEEYYQKRSQEEKANNERTVLKEAKKKVNNRQEPDVNDEGEEDAEVDEESENDEDD